MSLSQARFGQTARDAELRRFSLQGTVKLRCTSMLVQRKFRCEIAQTWPRPIIDGIKSIYNCVKYCVQSLQVLRSVRLNQGPWKGLQTEDQLHMPVDARSVS